MAQVNKKYKKVAEDENKSTFDSGETLDSFGRKVNLNPGVEAQEMETQASTPLIDDASGQAYIIRCFQFKIHPNVTQKPTKQELLNGHAHLIRTYLWKDSLLPVEEVDPKVVFDKDGKGYRIFVTCIPRLGEALLEKVQTLQEITRPMNG